jgi:hypothetical protein
MSEGPTFTASIQSALAGLLYTTQRDDENSPYAYTE